MTDDPHIAVIGPLALACLRDECPPEILRDAVAETGYVLPSEGDNSKLVWLLGVWTNSPRLPPPAEGSRRWNVLSAIVRHWRECQAAEALRAAPPDGAGTYYHETPR